MAAPTIARSFNHLTCVRGGAKSKYLWFRVHELFVKPQFKQFIVQRVVSKPENHGPKKFKRKKLEKQDVFLRPSLSIEFLVWLIWAD